MTSRLIAIACALTLVSASATAQVVWEDNFDGYTLGDLVVQDPNGDWEGWDGDVGATAEISDEQALSGTQSVKLLTGSDLVQPFSGIAGGLWTLRASVYVPADHTAETYFILLNGYPSAAGNWSTQLRITGGQITAQLFDAEVSTDVVVDAWAEIRVEFNLDTNEQSIYYDGTLLRETPWQSGGNAELQGIDLYSAGGSPVYIDDMSLERVRDLVNVAPLGTATQSSEASGGAPARAIDGNTNGAWGGGSITHTDPADAAPSWEVDLGEVFEDLVLIKLWNRTDACCMNRLTDFTVTVFDGEGGEVYTSDHFVDNTTNVPSEGYEIELPEGTDGQVVRVSRNGPDTDGGTILSLAEVQVFVERGNLPPRIAQGPQGAELDAHTCYSMTVSLFNADDAESVTYQWQLDGEDIPGATGDTLFVVVTEETVGSYTVTVDVDGRILVSEPAVISIPPFDGNIAVWGTATQSSTGFGGAPSRAIDGNTSGQWASGTISHTTNEAGSWWEVELFGDSTVDTIVLWNRMDCCSERLSNFRVSVLDGDRVEVWGSDHFTDLSFPDTSAAGYEIDAEGVEGRYVRVERLGADSGGNNFMSLAECQVFGEGPEPEAPELSSNLALRCGTTAGQSSNYNATFVADLAIDGNLGNFTHTVGTDDNATLWIELVEEFDIGSIVIHNRDNCCHSRLRDLIVTVQNAAGDVVYESDLLNPENELGGGVLNVGPDSITIDLQFGEGVVAAKTVTIRRVPDPDLSGTAGEGNPDEANILSLGEVQIYPPLECPDEGDTTCDGLDVEVVGLGAVFGEAGNYRFTATATDVSGDAISYSLVADNGVDDPIVAGPQADPAITIPLTDGSWTVTVTVDDGPCDDPAGECSTVVDIGPQGIGPFLRGDCNGDGAVVGQVGDAVFTLNYNFLGGTEPPCMAACDSNGDGAVVGQVGDAVYTLNFNFLGGPPPMAPFPDCATSDAEGDMTLGCETPIDCP